MPEAPLLSKLRRNIDRHPQGLKRILVEAGLRREFLKGVANNEAKAVKAFCDHNSESALKTKPKVSQQDIRSFFDASSVTPTYLQVFRKDLVT